MMSPRATGSIGIGVVVLQLIGAALVLSAGPQPLTAEDVAPYLSSGAAVLLVGMLGALAALTALIVFLTGLRSVIEASAEGAWLGPLAFGAGLVGVGVSYVGTALVTSAILFAREGRPPEIVAAVYETGSELLVLAGLPMGLAIAATTLALGRSGRLAGPLALIGWVAVALEVGSVVASLTLADPSSRVAVGAMGVIGVIVWVAATSVTLIVGPRTPPGGERRRRRSDVGH